MVLLYLNTLEPSALIGCRKPRNAASVSGPSSSPRSTCSCQAESARSPLGDAPPLPSNLDFYMGDARGRFEGETLVVETTNFWNII